MRKTEDAQRLQSAAEAPPHAVQGVADHLFASCFKIRPSSTSLMVFFSSGLNLHKGDVHKIINLHLERGMLFFKHAT